MKLRIINLTSEQLVGLLQGKVSPFASGLPSDAELLDAKVDLFSRQVSLIVRSESFEDVVDTVPIPNLVLSVPEAAKTTPTTVLKPVATVKVVEVKPESSPAVAKPPQPDLSRYAHKMENEFSSEQRKLLSFSVKDDCVVVKPVMFLKAEWDDINEVVRGIGGRWVKGDIISYWEIPLL